MRSRDFTKVIYETTEYIINVPIRIKMDSPKFNGSVQDETVDESEFEETEVELDPEPMTTMSIVSGPDIDDTEDEVEYVGAPNEDPMPQSNIRKKTPDDPSKINPNPVFVSPLQQEIELKKAEVGKQSPVIKKLTRNEINPPEKYS
jgi:hypothetical protein